LLVKVFISTNGATTRKSLLKIRGRKGARRNLYVTLSLAITLGALAVTEAIIAAGVQRVSQR